MSVVRGVQGLGCKQMGASVQRGSAFCIYSVGCEVSSGSIVGQRVYLVWRVSGMV